MPKLYLALYKGRKAIRHPRDLWLRLSDGLVRLLTRSPYSHCEIALLDEMHQYPPHIVQADGSPAPTMYICYSSSARDGGVRKKVMPLPADKWDLIELQNGDAAYVAAYFEQTQGRRDDWGGLIGVPFGRWELAIAFNNVDKWFCSEWCAAVLGCAESWRLSPGALAKLHTPAGAPK